MKILIVDDSIDKLDNVTRVLTKTNLASSIDSVEDIQGALNFLSSNEIDLLILDQQLPQRKDDKEDVLKNGGELLLNEINRKREKIFVPKYIIGLTQYLQPQANFSKIWSLLEYSPSSTSWSDALESFLDHISHVILKSDDLYSSNLTKPTIYLEGLTDVTIINKVLQLTFSHLIPKITLKSRKNAGANWVAQQLIIWGHMYHKTSENTPIKALGLFDSDTAGLKAREEVIKKLSSGIQQNTTKTLTLSAKYNPHIIEYYRVGIQIEIEIENLFPLKILVEADRLGWLEYRSPIFKENPTDWKPITETIPDYLKKKGISGDLIVYLKKVKINRKEDFVNLILTNAITSPDIFINFHALIEDMTKCILDDETTAIEPER